jgi:phycobilisome protein
VSHPSLGLPPRDERSGYPDAAARLVRDRARIGQRALEIAVDRDPGFRDRHDELALRKLLRDTEILIDRLALCVASNDPEPMRDFADQVVPVYRRRKVSMDDLVKLLEGLRSAAAAHLSGEEAAPIHAAIDAAIGVFKWHRRIAGDARKKNRLLQAIYKGA